MTFTIDELPIPATLDGPGRYAASPFPRQWPRSAVRLPAVNGTGRADLNASVTIAARGVARR